MFQVSRLLIGAFVFITMSGFGCNDMGAPPITNPQFFDIEYWFVNQGDPDIRAVEILSVTRYPKENESRAAMRNFQMPGALDTLKDIAPLKGYLGCTTQLGVYINKAWEQDTVPCWRFYYFPGYDSVDIYEKRVRILRWPEDTTSTIHEYVDRVGFCKPK